MACRLAQAGADALVLFNRFYQPDLDLEHLEVVPNLVLSTSDEMRLVLRWMALLRGRVDTSLAATTGVHSAGDVLKLVLAGADVTMMASALIKHGPELITSTLAEVADWLEARDYLSHESSPDPSAFERANYMQALVEYASET